MIRTALVAMLIGSVLAGASADAAVQEDGAAPPLTAPVVDAFAPDVRTVIQHAYERAADEPTNADRVGRLGMLLQVHGAMVQARQVYRRATVLDPANVAWHYYLGMVHAGLGDLDAALDQFSAVEALQPGHEAAGHRRSNLLLLAGEFEQGREAYAALAERHPDSALALYGLARAQEMLGDTTAARDTYERACRAAPTFGACHYALGILERRLGRTAAAEASAALAMRYRNQRPTYRDPLAEQLTQLATGVYERVETANALIARGRLEDAAVLFEGVLADDPENVQWLSNLLKTSTLLKRFERVDDLYRQALESHGEVAEIHRVYATSLMWRGRPEQARAVLVRALALDPDDAHALTMLGELFEAEGDPERATVYYDRALTARPSFRPARLNRAKRFITAGRDEEALVELRRVIDGDAADAGGSELTASAMILAAGAAARRDEPEQGRQYLDQARRLAVDRGLTDLLAAIDNILERLQAPH